MNKNKKIHLVLSSVGGSGRTTISAILADISNAYVIEGDILNPSISMYTKLNRVEARMKYGAIDDLSIFVNETLESALLHLNDKKGGEVFIDVGSSTTLPFLEAVVSDGYMEGLEKSGIELLFHVIIPGENFKGGLSIFDYLLNIKNFLKPNTIIIWINEYKENISRYPEVSKRTKVNFRKKIAEALGVNINSIVEIPTQGTSTRNIIKEFLTTSKSTIAHARNNSGEAPSMLNVSAIKTYYDFYKNILERITLPKRDKTGIEEMIKKKEKKQESAKRPIEKVVSVDKKEKSAKVIPKEKKESNQTKEDVEKELEEYADMIESDDDVYED